MLPVIRLTYPVKPFWVYALSDLHLDSDKCDKEKLKTDLEEALSLDARIWIGGDVWSMIFPSDLKRFNSGKHGKQRDAMYNMVVKEAFDFLKPYVNNIDLICTGNHEVSILKYHHADPTLSLIEKLQTIRNPDLPNIRHGGYTGWIRITYTSDSNDKHTTSEDWYYHHGKGGNAPVTRGALDLFRIRAEVWADAYWLGHKHVALSDTPVIKRLDKYGTPIAKQVLPFYSEGYEGKMEEVNYDEEGYTIDWANEKFYGTSGTGCAKIYIDPVNENGTIKIRKKIVREVA